MATTQARHCTWSGWMRMCREILTLGEIRVRRPDAAELAFHPGWRLVLRALARLRAPARGRAVGAVSDPPLPHTPDHERVNELCCELIEAQRGTQARAGEARGPMSICRGQRAATGEGVWRWASMRRAPPRRRWAPSPCRRALIRGPGRCGPCSRRPSIATAA